MKKSDDEKYERTKKILTGILIVFFAAVILIVGWLLLNVNSINQIQSVRYRLHIQFATLIIEAKITGELEDYSEALSPEALEKLQLFDIDDSEILAIEKEDSLPGYTATLVDGRYFYLYITDDYEFPQGNFQILFSGLSEFDDVSDDFLIENTWIEEIYDIQSP